MAKKNIPNGNIKNYKKYLLKKNLVVWVLFILMLIVAVCAINVGSFKFSFTDIIKAIFRQGPALNTSIVYELRLPRIVGAIVVGFALALAGCVMQGVLQNPLASASTLGVSQGAAFGATMALIILNAISINAVQNTTLETMSPYIVSLFAFLGGMITVLVILGLAKIKKISPASMILAGVALSALFNGGTIIAQYFANEEVLASIVYWTFGDLGRITYTQSAIIVGVSALSFIFFIIKSWDLNAMQNGTGTATSLGVNVNRLTLVSMVIAALLSSVAVAFAGIISFIGLLAPHIVRKFVGNDYRFLLPASAFAGAIILLLSDIIAKTIVQPVVLPIGAITSFLGAPMFLILIYKGNK